MKEKMFLSIAIIVMFVMVLYAPATINTNGYNKFG